MNDEVSITSNLWKLGHHKMESEPKDVTEF